MSDLERNLECFFVITTDLYVLRLREVQDFAKESVRYPISNPPLLHNATMTIAAQNISLTRKTVGSSTDMVGTYL